MIPKRVFKYRQQEKEKIQSYRDKITIDCKKNYEQKLEKELLKNIPNQNAIMFYRSVLKRIDEGKLW